jgi:hypothetical protein
MIKKPIKLTMFALSVLILISCNLISVLQPAPAAAANTTPTVSLAPTQAQPAQQDTKPAPRLKVGGTRLPVAPTVVLTAPTSAATIAPCDRARLVGDVSVPAGTVVHSGDPVVKTWRVMNVGSCTWTTAYRLVFDRGYDFLSTRAINLAGKVAPGATVDLTLTFPAPAPVGNYESYWNLQSPAGTFFGVGPNGDVPLDIRITVQPGPAKTPTP